MYRLKWLFMLMALIIFFQIDVDAARAAPKLEVKAEIGVNNTVKLYQPLPIKLTITNNGSDFSGDLVIDAKVTYSAGSAQVYPLDLAEGETKTLTIYLDGFSDDYFYLSQNEPLFFFYEGGIEKGKKIDYSGDQNPRFRYFHDGDTSFIFTYTENSDRLAALLRLKQYAPSSIEIFHLNQLLGYEFPSNYKGLAMADLFVVDEMNIGDLPEEKQQALLEWVEKGGILLVGAHEQIDRSMGILSDYLPLQLSSEKVVVTKEALGELSKGGIFTDNIEVFQATERKGSKKILADGDTILASSIDLGKGRIIQTTFSLGDQPLSVMDGYGKLLSEILDVQTSFAHWSRGNYLDSLSYELKNINELFPSFQVNTVLIIATIILYMFIVGPILYLLLKKLDKREHAWWVIPVLSIGLTLLMFMFGAKDRILQPQIHQSAFYKVDGKNLTGYYAESILTNRGGDFVLTMDENTTSYASIGYGVENAGSLHEKAYTENHGNGSSIHLHNLNYWAVQSVIGETNIPNAGNFEIDLTVKDSVIEGTVKNNFPFIIKDATIWSGSRKIEIGDLKPNETVEVSKEIKSLILIKPVPYRGYWDEPKEVKQLIPKRIEQLQYQSLNLVDENQPVLVGWTEEALVGIQLENSAELSPIAVIVQPFQPKLEIQGEFTVNDSMMETYVYPMNGGYADIMDEQTKEWNISPGEHEYRIAVPKEIFKENLQLTEMKIKNHEKNRVTMSIWNFKTNQYEAIPVEGLTMDEKIEQYFSDEHEIRMLLQVSADGDESPMHLPSIELKGVAKND